MTFVRNIWFNEWDGIQHSSITHECKDRDCEYTFLNGGKFYINCDVYDMEVKFCPECGEKLEITADTIVVERINSFIKYPYKQVQAKRKYEEQKKEQQVITYNSWVDMREQMREDLIKSLPFAFSGMMYSTLFNTGQMSINDTKKCLSGLEENIKKAQENLNIDDNSCRKN